MANRNKPLAAHLRIAQAADAALARHLSWHKWPLARQLDYIFSGAAAPDIGTGIELHSVLAELHQWCVAGWSPGEQERIRHFLAQLAGRPTNLFTRPELALGLAHVGLHFKHRVRELATWRPRSGNPFRQLDSLVRHLFDRYGDVPAWVLHRWGQFPDPRNQLCLSSLAVHLGQGGALRASKYLPVALTKRQEHLMRQAPAGCTFQEAYRYAQLAERDAAEWLGVALDSRLGREPVGPDDALWLAVLDMFRAEPDVDAWQFGPVCDWIHFRRRVGTATEPAQPGFSVRGRSLASLLAHTARWHRRLGQQRGNPRYLQLLDKSWAGLPVPGFVGGDGEWVRIRQLLDYPALLEEGQQMHHCVSSYVHQCVRGRAGIYSLTFNGARMLTLEVSPERQLVQMRGRHNRRASPEERSWVLCWLTENRLTAPDYVWQ